MRPNIAVTDHCMYTLCTLHESSRKPLPVYIVYSVCVRCTRCVRVAESRQPPHIKPINVPPTSLCEKAQEGHKRGTRGA